MQDISIAMNDNSRQIILDKYERISLITHIYQNRLSNRCYRVYGSTQVFLILGNADSTNLGDETRSTGYVCAWWVIPESYSENVFTRVTSKNLGRITDIGDSFHLEHTM